MTSRHTPHGGPIPEHRIQLFDSAESRAKTVAHYLAEGAQDGDTLLVVIAPEHWALVAERLQASVQTTRDGVSRGRLVMMDAKATLQKLSRGGVPDAELFSEVIGRLVAHLVTERRPLRIYGEMVDLLAAQADFRSAQRLGGFWNELGAHHAFMLLCGYSSVHFGDSRNAAALDAILGAHAHVGAPTGDHLAIWLLESRRKAHAAQSSSTAGRRDRHTSDATGA